MANELVQQLAQLTQGDHICPIYDTVEERLATAVPFVKDGLARGERCLYVADQRSFEQLCTALAAGSVDVAHERQRGAIALVTRREAFPQSGAFDPHEMIDFLLAAEQQALAAGYTGLRLAGEMTWALGPEFGNHRLIEFEALLNRALAGRRIVAMCQYDRQRFRAAVIYDVLRTHPIVIIGKQVYCNPYYEPPELVLGTEALASTEFKASRVDWWIAQLRRAHEADRQRERAEQQIRLQASLLDQVQCAVVATDRQRAFLYWNKAAEILFQWQAAEVLGRSDLAVNFPAGGAEQALRIQAAVEQSGRWEGEIDLRRKDGSVFAAHVVAALWRDAAGAPRGFLSVVEDVSARRHAEAERDRLYREVAANEELLAVLSRRLIEAQEDERRGLAHELHDEIGQIFTSIRLSLEALRRHVAPEVLPRVAESMQVVDRAIEQVRNRSLELRPAALDLLGLEPALRAHLNRLAAQAGLTVAFTSNLAEQRLPAILETVCFRVVQEAFTNVLRHARAAHCWIELTLAGAELDIMIRDNGIGFDVADARRRALRGASFGLLSMLERAQLFGGHIAIDSTPGRGTAIRIRFPVPVPPADSAGGG